MVKHHEKCQQVVISIMILHEHWMQIHTKRHDIHGIHGILHQVELEQLMQMEHQYLIGPLKMAI